MGLFNEGPMPPGVRAYLDRVQARPSLRRSPALQPQPTPPKSEHTRRRLRTRPYLIWVNPKPPRAVPHRKAQLR